MAQYLTSAERKKLSSVTFFWKDNLFFQFIFYWGNTDLLHYISFMCTTLYFHFWIAYNMLTTKNLVSIYHQTVDPFTILPCPAHPFTSGNHCSVPCIYMFVFVWFGLFIYFGFFICILYSTYEWNHILFVFLLFI